MDSSRELPERLAKVPVLAEGWNEQGEMLK